MPATVNQDELSSQSDQSDQIHASAAFGTLFIIKKVTSAESATQLLVPKFSILAHVPFSGKGEHRVNFFNYERMFLCLKYTLLLPFGRELAGSIFEWPLFVYIIMTK